MSCFVRGFFTEFEGPVEGVSERGPSILDWLGELGSRLNGKVQVEGRGQGPDIRLYSH